MICLLVFVFNVCEGLEFMKGLCVDDELEFWYINYSEEIELWIELGLFDEKCLKKVCNKVK